MVRIVTWNVNGLRAVVKKYGSLTRMLELLEADIICVQETKLTRSELSSELAICEGWDSYFSSCRIRQGYSGVATFCRTSVTTPSWAGEGFTSRPPPSAGEKPVAPVPDPFQEWTAEEAEELDREGRAIVTDHGAFVLINLYGPALSMEESLEERLKFKLRFYEALELRVRSLQGEGRHVVVVGDFNISPKPIDHCEPRAEFCKRPDRQWLLRLLSCPGDPEQPHEGGPLVDVFRWCHPDRCGAYTCWSVASGAKINNYGTRIDLILAAGPAGTSKVALTSHIRSSEINSDFEGSDHAPCRAELAFTELLGGRSPAALSMRRVFTGKQSTLRGLLALGGQKRGPGAQDGPNLQGGANSTKREEQLGGVHSRADGPQTASVATWTPPPRKMQRGIGAFLVSQPKAGRGSDGLGSLGGPGVHEGIGTAASPEGPWMPPDDASKAWLKIKKRMAPPACQGHREPCVVRVVKKAGPNQGRVFFVCARAAGKAPEGRCDHFQWASPYAPRKG
eukprot:jgi/Tetstr1/433752/TSEL_022971.t2